MKIKIENLTKRFNFQFIFQKVNLSLESGQSYAILGHNGSGKSTFIKSIIHFHQATDGEVNWIQNGKTIHSDKLYQYFAITAPYVDLEESLSLKELLEFHFKFKSSPFSIEEIIQKIGLEKHQNKLLSLFSSGMKQRVKLALTLYSDQAVWIFDEPTMNLDAKGVNWFLEQIDLFGSEKLILLASNDEKEYQFCDHIIDIEDYKKS